MILGCFSRANEYKINVGMSNRDELKYELFTKAFNRNKKKSSLTSASTRKIAAVHGACGATPVPSWLFPVTTGVIPQNKRKYDNVPAFEIERNKNEIFVKFLKPIQTWLEIDMELYKIELNSEIENAFSPSELNIFKNCSRESPGFQSLIEETKKEISELYGVPLENIEIGNYHGGQIAYIVKTKKEFRKPYLFKGFQIRIWDGNE